jgi:SNF2 family DNA or RNA helicase
LELLLARGSLEFPKQPFAYQLQGVAFLYPRFGALLADEMGLGKTMQAITAIRLLLFTGEIGRVLLVCPKPLVSNWVREFALWAPEVSVSVIEGDPQRRSWQWQLPRFPVKIANYELLTRDASMLADLQLQFDLVVLDEAQRIKNPKAATNDALCGLHRSRSWALTGTPIENSLADLSGIFEFVAPGRVNAEMKPRAVGRAVGDFVLRRTKDKVLADLPPKLFRDAELELTSAQRETYSLAENDGILRLTAMGDSATIQHLFELILRLKQICNFDPATGESSKLERLAADLDEIAASGQKAIVFSQWVDTLGRLNRELSSLKPLQYHGKIPMRDRDGIIEQFRTESHRHVLLMTYGTGDEGLNLQFCN